MYDDGLLSFASDIKLKWDLRVVTEKQLRGG